MPGHDLGEPSGHGSKPAGRVLLTPATLLDRGRFSAGHRMLISAGAGIVAGIVVAVVAPWWIAPLVGWDVAAASVLAWTWLLLWEHTPAETAAHANRESPTRTNADLLLLTGSLVSLLAVGVVLVKATSESGLDKGLLVGTTVLSIVIAWATVHTVYALRYAALYYNGRPGGVDFKDDDLPSYSDFAYLALTIGMTFQVSDTDLNTRAFRRIAIRHALLAYFFGALIIATTINFIAGLGS